MVEIPPIKEKVILGHCFGFTYHVSHIDDVRMMITNDDQKIWWQYVCVVISSQVIYLYIYMRFIFMIDIKSWIYIYIYWCWIRWWNKHHHDNKDLNLLELYLSIFAGHMYSWLAWIKKQKLAWNYHIENDPFFIGKPR